AILHGRTCLRDADRHRADSRRPREDSLGGGPGAQASPRDHLLRHRVDPHHHRDPVARDARGAPAPASLIAIVRADITTLDVDVIVNAANERMLGGGGVDGAIHRAAGRELYEACLAVPEVRPGVRCPTGESRITPGFNLPARHVIHTVGPIWRG